MLIPSPVKVGEEFVKLFTQGLEGSTSHVTLPGHIRISLLRFATGYVLAAVSAILLGLILGSLPKVFQFINPILQIIRPIAPVAFLPFIVFWFGIGDVPAIVIIFIAGFFPILLSGNQKNQGCSKFQAKCICNLCKNRRKYNAK